MTFYLIYERKITSLFLKIQYDGHCQFIIFTGLKPFYAECSWDPDKALWEYFKHDDGKSIAQYIKRCIHLKFCFSDISAGQHKM